MEGGRERERERKKDRERDRDRDRAIERKKEKERGGVGADSDRAASLLLWMDTVQHGSFSFALVVNECYLETPVTRVHMLQALIKLFVSMAQQVSLGISEAGSPYARTARPVQRRATLRCLVR